MSRPYLAICAIFKNEAPYLREWIEFHRLMGVEHFYLYNNFSEDDYGSVLADYTDRKTVTLYRWNEHPGQVPSYNHCLETHRKDARWMAFIDCDEFLFAPPTDVFRDALVEFEKYPGLAINWLMFGANGHRTAPAGLVIENYTRRGENDVRIPEPTFLVRPDADPADILSYRPFNTQIKSIVDPMRTISCSNPHSFRYAKGGLAVNENHEPVHRWTNDISVQKLRLNHYWSKSEEEFGQKVRRGRSDMEQKRKLDEFPARDQYLNMVEDTEILRYLPRVKAMVEESKALLTRQPAPALIETPAVPRRSNLLSRLLGR